MSASGVGLFFQAQFLRVALARLGTIGYAETLHGGHLLGLSTLPVGEADGGCPEEAPALACAA